MEREIYCPYCKRFLFKYNGKFTNRYRIRCRKCNVDVIYDTTTDTIKTEKYERTTSSGMRF